MSRSYFFDEKRAICVGSWSASGRILYAAFISSADVLTYADCWGGGTVTFRARCWGPGRVTPLGSGAPSHYLRP
jgi:hypothetical protein